MSEQAQAIASEIAAANAELVETLEQLSDEQWQAPTPGEGWTVAAVASHVADVYEMLMGYVRGILTNDPVPPITIEKNNQVNAERSAANARADKQEAIERLRRLGAETATAARALSDAELEMTGIFAAALPPMTVAQFLRMIDHHTSGHLASIQAVTQRQAANTSS